MDTVEKNVLIARRVPPGDRWQLVDDDSKKIYLSLTEVLEAYYQKTTIKPQAFRLEPLKSCLYLITTENFIPPPPKTFNIYGE